MKANAYRVHGMMQSYFTVLGDHLDVENCRAERPAIAIRRPSFT